MRCGDPPPKGCVLRGSPQGMCEVRGAPREAGLSHGAASAEESRGDAPGAQLGSVTPSPKTGGLGSVTLSPKTGVSPRMAAQLKGSLVIPCSQHMWGTG